MAVTRFTMSNSAVSFVPAARCCARVGLYLFASIPQETQERGGRSADRRTYSVVAVARRDWSARVRRGASHDAGRSPLGAPPWRFSAGGRASISGIASGSVQRAPRSQVVMPGGRCPGQPGCQTAQCSSFPRRVVAPGLVSIHSRPSPKRGVGGAPTGALSLLSRLRDATGPRPARRGASHDAGRSPLGAPPWRFSAGGRASISGIASGSVQRAPRSQVVMPGGRCPGQPAHRSETSGDGR